MKILIILLLSTTCLIAQTNGVFSSRGGKAYIGISVGPSFPLGDFGEANPLNEKSGYAKTGYSLEISGGLRLLNLFEISIVGFRNSNATNIDNLINSFNQSNPGSQFSGSSDSWSIYGALGGLGLSYPVGSDFFADIRVLGGYLNSTSPEISLNTSSPDTYAKILSSTASGFVYYFSGGVRRPLTDKLHAVLGIQYTSTTSKFDDVKTITSVDGNVEESITSFDRGIDVWGITLGFRYFLF